ncbi:MAG: DUF5666 domain-containing protein [Candidatus Binatia bacterium]
MDHDRKLGVFAGIVLVTMAACGGGGGGGGAGTTTSTISGNVANQATALRMPSAPRTMLARLIDALSPVSAAFAGRNGIHVSVGGLETETDSNGFFSITGPFSGPVTVSFGNGNRTFTLTIDVPPGATVVLRDVFLRDDGTAEPAGQGFFAIFGTLGEVSCDSTPQTLAVELGSQSIVVGLGPDTRIRIAGTDESPSCADLAEQTGMPVRAAGEQLDDGSLLARRVKVGAHGSDDHHRRHVEFHGVVTALACPDSITVERTDGESVTVTLTDETEFEDGVACEDLAGQSVEVEGKLTDDGVVATEIEVEDGDDGGDDESGE